MQPILSKTPPEKPSPPPVPSGPGPFTFRCVLIAAGPAELEELGKIFTTHRHEVIKEGAAGFELKTSVDMKCLQIEEVSEASFSQCMRGGIGGMAITHEGNS
jgi:hypothetical protein